MSVLFDSNQTLPGDEFGHGGPPSKATQTNSQPYKIQKKPAVGANHVNFGCSLALENRARTNLHI